MDEDTSRKDKSSSSSPGQDGEFYKLGLDPKLIHRILLADSSEFGALTMSGNPQIDTQATPSFDEFSQGLASSTNVPSVMKRAYRDQLCEKIYSTQNMKPMHNLLLELHTMVRSLVPNRSDLHSMLSDNDVLNTKSPLEVVPFIIKSGEALAQLESEARAESTRHWIEKMNATKETSASKDIKEYVFFLVTSVLYLFIKAQLCESDKQDFYLQNVWAPYIHSHAKEVEIHSFEKRFGLLSDNSTAPLTRTWIQQLVNATATQDRQRLQNSSEDRMDLIRMGWVDDILFRPSDRSSLHMPEILALDHFHLQSIRDSTKIAAAGSTLALHACNAAGIGVHVFNEAIEQSSPIDLRRQHLVNAMSQRIGMNQETYEQSVADSVVALAKEWNSSLSHDAIESLQGRTASVLRGEDAVIKLLDSRIKDVFRYMMLWKAQNCDAPHELRTGRGKANFSPSTETSKMFQLEAIKQFCRRGLSFYSSDLSNTSWAALKVVNLSIQTFKDDLIEKVILDACSASNTL